MVVAPSRHSEAFEVFVTIRRRTSAKVRLKLLHQQCVSYRSNLHFISEQQAGRRPHTQTSPDLKRSMIKMRHKLTATLQEIREIEGSLESYASISMDSIRKEFAQLCANPHLMKLSVTNERTLQLIVRARYTQVDITYDLGDWSFEIGHPSLKQDLKLVYNVHEVRSGVLPSWKDTAPAYRLYDNMFCLGDNVGMVEEYLRERDYLGAIEVITFSLSNVNEEDVFKVPHAFKQVAA
jgi:hypothetical protein